MKHNFRELLEDRVIAPMTLILIFAFLARSSQIWSFGLVSIAALPVPFPTIINAVTGIAMAFAMETLTVAALSVAYTRYGRMKDLEINGDMVARMRKPMIAKLSMQTRIFGAFGAFGAGCSTFAIVSYALGYSHTTSLAGIAGEVVTALAMQVGLVYFGVLHEREIADPVAQHMGLAISQVGTLARSLGDKIAAGGASDGDIRTFQRMIPPEMRRMLDPLIKGAENIETWDVRKIAQFLLGAHASDEASMQSMMRSVRRKLSARSHEADLGIGRAKKGTGYVCPVASVFLVFSDEIEALIQSGQAPDKPRTTDGLEVALAAMRTGPDTDNPRTNRPTNAQISQI